MGSGRLAISDAAAVWLDRVGSGGVAESAVRQALDDFLAGRFFGYADRLRAVHDFRRSLFDDRRPVWEVAGVSVHKDDAELDLVAKTATNPEKGRLLFHLARVMAPGTALELGTSIGVSAAYIAFGLAAGGGGKVVTIDGSEARASLAAEAWAQLGVENVEQVVNRFDNVLHDILDDLAPRFAYVDGNHHRDATLRYFEAIREAIDEGVVVLDDIRWSEDMERCWDEIVATHPTTLDLGWVGLALID